MLHAPCEDVCLSCACRGRPLQLGGRGFLLEPVPDMENRKCWKGEAASSGSVRSPWHAGVPLCPAAAPGSCLWASRGLSQLQLCLEPSPPSPPALPWGAWPLGSSTWRAPSPSRELGVIWGSAEGARLAVSSSDPGLHLFLVLCLHDLDVHSELCAERLPWQCLGSLQPRAHQFRQV